MRPSGGGLASLAIAVAIVASACVAAPSRQLRVIEGGSRNPTPIPTQSSRPEPPIGVIFFGRVVLPCEYGPRCQYFARLLSIEMRAAAEGSPTVAAVGPTATPLPLDAAIPARGLGPTARAGSAIEDEPADPAATLEPGDWRLEVYARLFEPMRGRPVHGATTQSLACTLDFSIRPGDVLDLAVAFETPRDCQIALTSTFFAR